MIDFWSFHCPWAQMMCQLPYPTSDQSWKVSLKTKVRVAMHPRGQLASFPFPWRMAAGEGVCGAFRRRKFWWRMEPPAQLPVDNPPTHILRFIIEPHLFSLSTHSSAGSKDAHLMCCKDIWDVCLTLSFTSFGRSSCHPRRCIYDAIFPLCIHDACIDNVLSMIHVSLMQTCMLHISMIRTLDCMYDACILWPPGTPRPRVPGPEPALGPSMILILDVYTKTVKCIYPWCMMHDPDAWPWYMPVCMMHNMIRTEFCYKRTDRHGHSRSKTHTVYCLVFVQIVYFVRQKCAHTACLTPPLLPPLPPLSPSIAARHMALHSLQ